MRATRAVIRVDHFLHNLEQVRLHVGRETKICVPVKADAYGHGAVELGRAAFEAGMEYIAVATVDEGRILRGAGLRDVPIILFSHADSSELEELAQLRLEPFVGSIEYADALDRAARGLGTTLRAHLKIDTGMGRLGCRPEAAVSAARAIDGAANLTLAGCATHFPISDSADPSFTDFQIGRFTEAVGRIRTAGIDPGIVHAANSGAIIAHPAAWLDMVRPGIISYGYYPSRDQERVLDLKPVMEFRTRISFLKTVEKGQTVSYGRTWTAPERRIIATLPVGYADGYNRLLSNKGVVAVGGEEYPIAGRVCMDQTMVDLGPAPESAAPIGGDANAASTALPPNADAIGPFAVGDDVVLFGQGDPGWTGEDVATTLDTIPYEVTCWVNKRVPRVYVEDTTRI